MTIRVRPDILARYPDLFGPKKIGSRTVDTEALIGALTTATLETFQRVLAERHASHARIAAGRARFGFAELDAVVEDPDGATASAGDIRQGMLDGFRGRASAVAWQIRQDVPDEVKRPGLEGTGPAIDLGMAFGALNSGAASWMWDWEDAGGDYADQLYLAWRHVKEILAGDWNDRPFFHRNKRERDARGAWVPRRYEIRVPRERWPVIFHRVPGLHLRNRQITLDGREVPAIIPALVIYALNNHESQRRHGSGIYFYVPKLEAWQEARLVGVLLRDIERAMGLPRGDLKIKVLNERGEFVLQQELIQWVLRANLIGTNVGRWDYLNSREDMFRHDPAMVIPNPNTVTMTEPSMTHYTRRNALLATLAGAIPIGGMSAQMQNPRAPQLDAKALRDIWFDKLRERLTGLFAIDGRLYDTYRQSWVATVAPDYVNAGREPLVADVGGLQAIVDSATPDERARLEGLRLLRDGQVAPLELSDSDLTVDALFSESEIARLFARPDGPTTEDGLRYALYMASEFMYQQLQGNNAAAIDDPVTGLRFMNDLATYEIFWHFLYLTVRHGATLTGDGRYSKAGDRVSPELFDRLVSERRATVKDFFAARSIAYESTYAELVLQILWRQIVERVDGRLVPQTRWIKYGSRVLLALIEESSSTRAAILDAVFSDRELLRQAVASAGDAAARETAQRALIAHDYVYDVI